MPGGSTSHASTPGREGWPRVLVVEDDESLLFALSVGLEREGLAVTAVRDGLDAVTAAEELGPDVVLLDVMLPGRSGIEICRDLRARGFDAPVVFVSARDDEMDVVVGIEVGGDDYLSKPFRMRELVARIRALLRRRWPDSAPPAPRAAAPAEEELLRVGDVVLDQARHEVVVRGEVVDLPLREFQLLQELLSNAGRVVARDTLLERIWGVDYDGDPRIVATLIGRLRSRIEEDPDAPVRIATIRGVGYRYNDRL